VEIDASKLAGDGLRLTFDGPRKTQLQIALAPSKGVSGKYISDERSIRIDAHSRSEIAVAEVLWPLESGVVTLEGAATVVRPIVKLTIPRGRGGTHGEVASNEMNISGLNISLDSLGTEPLRVTELQLRKVGMALDGKGGIAVVAEEVSAARVELTVGSTEVVIDGLMLAKVRLRRGKGGRWQVDATAIEATRIVIHAGALSLVISDPAIGELAWQAGGSLSIQAVEAPVLDINHANLFGPTQSKRSRQTKSKSPRRAKLDLSALDMLNGKLDVDLTAATTIPVIGTRRATHHFRLKVDHGQINYYRLEKSLSRLEDALLDFEVQGQQLVLVVDLALKKRKIVSWKLDPDEVPLAQRRLVRLRRLLQYELAAGKTKTSKQSFVVRELMFDNIDVVIKLLGGSAIPIGTGVVHLGAPRRAAIANLQAKGRICHRPKGDPVRGRLDICAERLFLGADDISLGARRLAAAAVQIGAIDQAEVRFVGIRPKSFHAAMREIIIDRLQLTAPQ